MNDNGKGPVFLPATAYRPEDLVMGTDEGGKHFGQVSPHQGRAQPGTVLVYWSEEEYTSSALGHVVEADMVPALQLWPAAAHVARLAEMERQAAVEASPQKAPAVYGYCPQCGAPGVRRERRLNGNDRCEKGHEYPSLTAVQPVNRA